jgi:predicted small lipoprotein YifL
MRRLVAIGMLTAASLGLAACGGDGDVVFPSDTKPKPHAPATTAQQSICDQIRATTTTRLGADQKFLCVELRK